MLYVVGLISGIINGLFASGAGQILVFYLVFVQKMETHTGRATSLFCTSVATVVSIINYWKIVAVDYSTLITVAVVGIAMGCLGAKFMNKIEANKLNILSGVIITFFAVYSLIVRG